MALFPAAWFFMPAAPFCNPGAAPPETLPMSLIFLVWSTMALPPPVTDFVTSPALFPRLASFLAPVAAAVPVFMIAPPICFVTFKKAYAFPTANMRSNHGISFWIMGAIIWMNGIISSLKISTNAIMVGARAIKACFNWVMTSCISDACCASFSISSALF